MGKQCLVGYQRFSTLLFFIPSDFSGFWCHSAPPPNRLFLSIPFFFFFFLFLFPFPFFFVLVFCLSFRFVSFFSGWRTSGVGECQCFHVANACGVRSMMQRCARGT